MFLFLHILNMFVFLHVEISLVYQVRESENKNEGYIRNSIRQIKKKSVFLTRVYFLYSIQRRRYAEENLFTNLM